MRIRPTLQIAKSLHVKDTNHVLAVKKKNPNCLSAQGDGTRAVRQYGGMHVAGVAKRGTSPWFGSDPKLCCVRLT